MILTPFSENKWASVSGIVSSVQANAINVQVSSMSDNFLLPRFSSHLKNSSNEESELCEVDLQQRSQSKIMEIAMKSLSKLKLTPENSAKASLMVFNPSQEENGNLHSIG